jgi:alginate O-acetyltransferase complex protein AlgI
MRPFRIFAFLIILAALLATGSLLFPAWFGNDILSVIGLQEQVPTDSVSQYPEKQSDTVLIQSKQTQLPQGLTDSLPVISVSQLLPDKNEGGKVRIMVFGDSQLEGDRLTYLLRSNLRSYYGGSGPGLLQPLMPVMYTRTVEVRSSANWERYTYLSYREGLLPHTRIGPFMSVCRYLAPDSVSPVKVTATVRLTPSIYADTLSSIYDNLHLLYGNLQGECVVTVSSPGGILAIDTLLTGRGPSEFICKTAGVSDLRITFHGYASPDIYGFSVDGDSGIIVDNIPHRGSAGLEFTMADRDNLRSILRMLDPRIIILQYGLNVVRNVSNDYSYYQKGLERQLTLLREICPGSNILLMSLTDMADADSGMLSSFSNISTIRDAQRNAAKSAGVAFWDAYEAMGGRNSIIDWAEQSPRLAQLDYTHLTYAGSDSVALMLLSDMRPEPDSSAVTFSDRVTIIDSLPAASEIARVPPKTTTPDQIVPGKVWQSIVSYRPHKAFIFTNLAFWGFLLILIAGYSIVYKKRFIRNFYLFLFSLFFYYKSGGFFLFLLILSTLTDYTAGRLIYRSVTSFGRRFWLIISLLVNLGMLAYFKYYGFIIETINSYAGTSFPSTDILAGIVNDLTGTSFDISSIVLPVGISFFTFQTISYTVDVYRRKIEPVRNIIDFGFYVSFFPQLVAGPIVRASEFIPQLYEKFSLSKREFGHATFLILRGLIKKMVISDFISTNFVDRVFDAPELYSGIENLFAVYGYGLQIYCDFSGYTDIAIGIALLLGFRLPYNFNSPYKATGVADFWRRWHISLSRWLRDYLYISIGGNRKGAVRTGINLMITMGLGGLWHGASGRFIVWGLLHGIGLVFNKIFRHYFPTPLRRNRLITFFQILITFNFVSFTWIFFRAATNDDAAVMINRIFTEFEISHLLPVLKSYTAVIMVMLTGYIFHFLPGRVKEAARGLFVQAPLILQFIAVLLVAVFLIQIQNSGVQPFIYFRF